VPLASREFARTDRLLVRIPAYGPGGTSPALSIHLLNRAGKSMTEMQATSGSGRGIQEVDLPLSGLAPGEYVLEIKSQTDEGAKQLLAFRVTG
jgi:hypothetical protein